MLGAGYLGARCLRDAGRASWALQASEGLAGAGRPPLCGPAKQVREAPLTGHLCLSRAAVSPPHEAATSPQQGSQAEAEEAASPVSGKEYVKAVYSHPAYIYVVCYR